MAMKPTYTTRWATIGMLCLRQTSTVFAPASCSFKSR